MKTGSQHKGRPRNSAKEHVHGADNISAEKGSDQTATIAEKESDETDQTATIAEKESDENVRCRGLIQYEARETGGANDVQL